MRPIFSKLALTQLVNLVSIVIICLNRIVEIVYKITMSKQVKLNTIRIIGGEWRGRRIKVPQVDGLRPTIDRVRETLFNWLMHDTVNMRCLDLFAGSGVLGLEALSRGAKETCFIEMNTLAVNNLLDNLNQLLGAEKSKSTTVIQRSAIDFLRDSPALPYDLVFIDPPFQSDLISSTLELLSKNGWLSASAIIYLEQPVKTALPIVADSWELHRQGKAGQSEFFLYRVSSL